MYVKGNVKHRNVHIDIHRGGGMEVTGIYGHDPEAVSWDYTVKNVGETTTFACTKK